MSPRARLDRRAFLRLGAAAVGGMLMPRIGMGHGMHMPMGGGAASRPAGNTVQATGAADHTIRIGPGVIELAPNRIVSTTLYNGQFPGPLLRLKEGRPVTIDLHNDTDRPEQFHWHGQFLPVEVDGSAEEGTPYIPPHGMRRITFTPGPAGFRWYHSHLMARTDLAMGLYTGQVGPVFIEPAHHPGDYDQEVFLVLKEFVPTFSREAEMEMDVLTPVDQVAALREADPGASMTHRNMPMGIEVEYALFSINGKMLGQGEPVRVKQGQRVLFHVLNGSATEIRSLALPGHTFKVVALDGNPAPAPAEVPLLWIGTGERVSAIVEMNRPGVWVMGEPSGYERDHGMGIVVAYAGQSGRPQWAAPARYRWDYRLFADPKAVAREPDETIEMTFTERIAAEDGFNVWMINGVAFSMEKNESVFPLKRGRRYRWRMRNASDDIHPLHLHRHSFELTKVAGRPTAGVIKDVVMVGPYQEVEVDFTADQPGLSLFHCHMQTHMDYGFMGLFRCE